MCLGACTVLHFAEYLGHWEPPDSLGHATDLVAFDIYPKRQTATLGRWYMFPKLCSFNLSELGNSLEPLYFY